MPGELVLPWPNSRLSPNSRTHWRRLAEVKQAAKREAWALAVNSKLTAPAGRPTVSMMFYPPDRRRRDLDNCIASMKPALDGIAQAMGVDDSTFRLQAEMADEVRPGGQVVVRVSDR